MIEGRGFEPDEFELDGFGPEVGVVTPDGFEICGPAPSGGEIGGRNRGGPAPRIWDLQVHSLTLASM